MKTGLDGRFFYSPPNKTTGRKKTGPKAGSSFKQA
jgi:hypothetical protein